MPQPPPELFGIQINEIARICKVSLKTAIRWKSGQSVPPATALMILGADLGCFSAPWSGWIVRGEKLISPEGWEITRNDVLSAPLLRSQLAIYQSENRNLKRALSAQEIPMEQPLPDDWGWDLSEVQVADKAK